MIGSYQRGYDKVNLLFNDEKQLVWIQKKMQEFMGFEIMERTSKGCIIQSIAKKLDIDFEMALRKAFLIVKEMASITLDSYNKNDKNSLRNIPYKDYEVNKFCYFCLRNINKQIYTGIDRSQGTHVLYFLIEMLENLGDSYKLLSKLLWRFKKDKDIISILQKVNLYLDQAYDFFYKPEQSKVLDALKTDQEILKSIRRATEQAIKNKALQKIYILNIMHEIVQLIYHFPSRRLDTLKWFEKPGRKL